MTISEDSLSISEDPTQGRPENTGWCIADPQEAQRGPIIAFALLTVGPTS